ncbi:MAG: ATP-binding protein [Lachnospiraceae bacterium]|nr:ATP-binding protein [Candidatus Colinaster scatohippi]
MSLSNSQFELIKRKYDSKRREAILESEKRLEDVKQNVDGYHELCDAISGLTVEHTKRAISGDKSAIEELSSIIADLSDQKLALLKASGYPEDYLEPRFECKDCKDTGFIGNERCHCLKQQIIDLLYSQSNIHESLDAIGFDMVSERYYKNEDLKHFIDTKQKSINFVHNFDGTYQNLLFYGTVGTGKSLLSSCIAKELLNSGHSVIYFSAISLFDELSKGTFDKTNSANILESIYDCDLLIIDDLGTEMTNSFTVSAFFSLINERALRQKPIVISTNLSLETLRDRYTDRTFSRITGSFTFCRLSGPDIRIAHKFVQ